jgi:hypothetical protein
MAVILREILDSQHPPSATIVTSGSIARLSIETVARGGSVKLRTLRFTGLYTEGQQGVQTYGLLNATAAQLQNCHLGIILRLS